MLNNFYVLRFAPSPTGKIHVGNLRTAITNYIISKKTENCKLILRIDDSDKERYNEKYKNDILKSMKFLFNDVVFVKGKNYFIQSELNKEIQNNFFKRNNFKYLYICKCKNKSDICECSKNEINTKDLNLVCNFAIKFNIKKLIKSILNKEIENSVLKNNFTNIDNKIYIFFKDLNFKKIKVELSEINDFTLTRNDGSLTYIYSSIVNDIDLNVDCVIRGNDLIAATFSQIIIATFVLNKKIPNFMHLPLLLNENGNKISKRDLEENFSLENILKKIEPKSLIYYLASTINKNVVLEIPNNGNKEVNDFFSGINDEFLIKNFTFKGLLSSFSQFNILKLNRLNKLFIKNKWECDNFLFVNNVLKKLNFKVINIDCHNSSFYYIVNEIVKRSYFMSDVISMFSFLNENINLNLQNIINSICLNYNDKDYDLNLIIEELKLIKLKILQNNSFSIEKSNEILNSSLFNKNSNNYKILDKIIRKILFNHENGIPNYLLLSNLNVELIKNKINKLII